MPIPGDAECRWWVEVSSANPKVVAGYRPALIAFIAFSKEREASLAGTGFLIAGRSDVAVVITAKHVLLEGVGRIQRPQSHAASALFVSDSASHPSLDPEKMKIIWMGSERAAMMNAMHLGYNDALDIACCVIEPQKEYSAPFRPTSIPLNTSVPRVGDLVHMVSHDHMEISELVEPVDRTGIGQQLSITKRISIRVGIVTAVHPSGFRQYKWPCFTTSIPAEPGMSGGLVVLPRDGISVASCGIVCADNSPDSARQNCRECGESVIACAWTALSLRVPDSIPSTSKTETLSLFDLMRSGRMAEPIGGLDCLEFAEQDNGNCTIGRR
jgi:hypothetical protein